MAGKITLTTFGIGAYGLQTGIIHWMALGYQQWGFLSGSGSSDFTWTYPQSFTSSVYSIQLAMRSGGSTTASYNAFKTTSYSLTKWQGYMSLKEDVSFFLLAIGRQMQWGRSTAATLNFSLPFQKFYCVTTAQESWTGATFENTSWIVRTNSSMTWPTHRGTNINYIAVGMQQWGYAQKLTSQYNFDWVYPIPFPTLVGAIMLTPQYEGQCRPHSINSFDRFSCSLRTDGTKPELNSNHVFAIGFQQWGVVFINLDSEKAISFNVSFSSICYCGFSTNSHQLHLSSDAGTSFYNITKSTAKISHTSNIDGNVFWLAIGKQQWGLAKIQPPGSVVNLNISCDIYCISATSIDGDWPYIKLIDNTKFKLVVNAQKAFWICLGIADKQQWGTISHSEWVVTTFTYPITMRKVYAAVLAREDAANNKTEYTVTLISKNRTSLQFNGWSGDANVIVIGS